MPTLETLHKLFTKIKNQLLSAQNYLELESAITLFNEIKLKYLDPQGKFKKSSQEDPAQYEEKHKLIETTQKLIKQKIKYFKKIALKKISEKKLEKSLNQERINKKQRPSKGTGDSSLTIGNKKKIKQSLPTFFASKQLKQLKDLQQKTFILQRTLNNSNEKSKRSPSRSQKKLKQSKSAQNFFSDKFKDSFTFRNDQKLERKSKKKSPDRILEEDQYYHGYDLDDDNKTQIKAFNKKAKNDFDNQQDLEYYRGRVEFLERAMGSIQGAHSGFFGDTKHLFEQYHYKLREKTLELEEVKNRLQFYQSSSQDLRNRVQNEQRRQEDYIQSLKEHIKRQDSQLFSYEKEKKVMGELIREYEVKIESQEKQKQKYIQQMEMMLEEKEREKAGERGKGEDLRKELQVMARQEGNIRELERLLREQKMEISTLLEKNALLSSNLQASNTSLNTVSQEKQMLEELLELKLQEIENYKVEIHQINRRSGELQNELNEVKSQLEGMRKKEQEEQRVKQKIMKKKVQKLKQVKTLLAETLA